MVGNSITQVGPIGAPMMRPYGAFFPKINTTPAIYRLLADHYLATGYAVAGTIVTEGKEIPTGWIPTTASEPQNQIAIQNFWAVGPRAQKDAEPLRDRFWSGAALFSQVQPVIYWIQIGNGLWQLTGAGASLGPKGGN